MFYVKITIILVVNKQSDLKDRFEYYLFLASIPVLDRFLSPLLCPDLASSLEGYTP